MTPTLKKEKKKILKHAELEYSNVNVQIRWPQTSAGRYDVSIL